MTSRSTIYRHTKTRCPACDKVCGSRDRLIMHAVREHMLPDIVSRYTESVFRKCWCGLFVHNSGCLMLATAEHFKEAGGVVKHFHDCLIGGGK